MATVVSTRCTYEPRLGLPELIGGRPTVVPDELLPAALALYGVEQVDAPVDAQPQTPESAQEESIVPDEPQV